MKHVRKYLFILLVVLTQSSPTYAQANNMMPRQESARVVHNLICRMRPVPEKNPYTGKTEYHYAITQTPVTNYEWWAVMSRKLYTDKRDASKPAIVKSGNDMTTLLTYEKKRDMVFIVADAEKIKLARKTIGLRGGNNSKGTGKNEPFFIIVFYDGWKKYTGKK